MLELADNPAHKARPILRGHDGGVDTSWNCLSVRYEYVGIAAIAHGPVEEAIVRGEVSIIARWLQ